jgi:hypothetical protein
VSASISEIIQAISASPSMSERHDNTQYPPLNCESHVQIRHAITLRRWIRARS